MKPVLTLASLAIALVGESRELGPLIGGQAPPHAKKHDGARLVQLGPGRLDDVDVFQDRGVVAALDEAVEFIFSPVEGRIRWRSVGRVFWKTSSRRSLCATVS